MSFEIGVRVLRGSEQPWLPVPAQPLSGVMDLYVILDYEVDPGIELEFKPGQIVIAVETPDEQGNHWPVALRYTGGAF